VSGVWVWMSRDDVVLCVSIVAIVLSLVGIAVTVMMEQRHG
jgi:hypothetical protein